MKKILTLLLIIALSLPAAAQVGRYKSLKTIYPGYSLKFDTSTGEYTTVKWAPKEYEADRIGDQVDTAVSKTIDKIKRLLHGLEESLEDLGRSTRDSIIEVQAPKDSLPQPQYQI